MIDFLSYLHDELGLFIQAKAWGGVPSLPVYLERAARYWLCSCNGVNFIAAKVGPGATLPELKRISAQLAKQCELSVMLVSEDANPRQRRALVQQGISFVVPGKQAYLPFLAFAATAAAKQRTLKEKLSPSAQSILVALIENPSLSSFGELKDGARMSSSSISRGIDELARRDLVSKTRQGRQVLLSFDKSALLRDAMPHLANPVAQVIYARKSEATEELPLAGESALAERSMLAPPRVEQRAVSKTELPQLDIEEVLLGELADRDTVQIQVWSYDPLVTGKAAVDNTSLALSLVDTGDERVLGELDALFGEEDLWQ